MCGHLQIQYIIDKNIHDEDIQWIKISIEYEDIQRINIYIMAKDI